jgi:alkylation response protein AidB-like acyl-CoA dehydrogenase
MRWLLEKCIQFSKRRKRFGQPISKFQLVATRIVDMKLRLEAARQSLYYSAWLRDQRKSAVLEASMTKLSISEAWIASCEDAMQIHGAAGYMADAEIERELRDALASRIYSGTNDIQRTIIAGLLGL